MQHEASSKDTVVLTLGTPQNGSQPSDGIVARWPVYRATATRRHNMTNTNQ